MSDPFVRSLESEEVNSLFQNLLQSSFAHAPPFSSHAPPPPPFGSNDTSAGFNFSDPGLGFMDDARGYDIDEFDSDCKGAEVSEDPSDSAPRRSSKRARAAEVHNMSEKRRRSRINEKMKALQKLIPNSNKTDKASMLDEAIEYLKQLQLQVQMLSMRNGVSLYPYSSHVPEPGLTAIEHELLTSREDAFSRNNDIPNQYPQSNQPNLMFPVTGNLPGVATALRYEMLGEELVVWCFFLAKNIVYFMNVNNTKSGNYYSGFLMF